MTDSRFGAPHLYFSRRRMLNRLSFDWQRVVELVDPVTRQTPRAAREVLLDLREMGLAIRSSHGQWRITDAGIMAMASNGVIYAESGERR